MLLCGIWGETKLATSAAVLALGALALLPAAAPAALEQVRAPAQPTLAALPLAAQGTISRVLGRDQPAYHTAASAQGFTVRNAPHALTARFTPGGLKARSRGTRLGLTLLAWGYGRALRPLAAAPPQAHANRILYRRGALTEWYVNGPLGLEQGFTLNAPPARSGSGPLTLALGLTGNARPSLLPDRKGVRFAHSALRYQGLTASDARGRSLPNWFELRGRTLRIRVDDAGARYPVTIDPFLQLAKLTAVDGRPYDNVGNSVAISGDTLVVGAPGNGAGAVYVFVKPLLGWTSATETAKLTGSSNVLGAHLGTSVAIDGDTIVAGTVEPHPFPPFDPQPNNVAVFVKPANGWMSGTETATLRASDDVNLGPEVAVSGDTIFIGHPVATVDGKIGQGAVYLYRKPGAAWMSMSETAKLTALDGAADDQLGDSVAVSGDTVAAGARICSASCSGAVYVFVKPPSGWATGTQTAKLTSNASIGRSVAVSGDTIATGGSNAVYVYTKPIVSWANAVTETAKLTSSDGASNFGFSVAAADDKIVVGANTFAPGAVYVFAKPALGWANATETAKLTASDAQSDTNLGWSVAVSGNTVFGGAPGARAVEAPVEAPSAPPSQGAVYVFADVTPTAVALRSFSARRNGDSVVVRWRTASETGTLGFNVYRERAGSFLRVNPTLIPSLFGGSASGHAYSWLDRNAPRRGGTLKYRLQTVNVDGTRRWTGAALLTR